MSTRVGRIGIWLVLVVCCLTLAGWEAFAGNWPRFRGPNGTGTAPDLDVPIRWNERENILWKTALPGPGNSSPVVWGDHIFLQSSTPDARERMLLCLSARDGKILWSRTVPGAPFKKLNPRNTHASSTPAADGERVYTIFWDGNGQTVHAYDFKGTPLWTHHLGTFTSQHGAGASPIVYDGRLYINNDQDGSAAVICLDAATGRQLWEAKRPAFRACYSAPFMLERPGEPPVLIVASTAGITAYNPSNGSEVWNFTWSFPGMALRTVGSPLYHQGLVFACAGDGSGLRHMIAVKADGRGDVSKTHLAWENRDKSLLPYVPTILARGGHLYYITDTIGLAVCMEAKTGKVVWSERLEGPVTASPVLIDGKVYAINEAGTVYVFAADPAGFKLLAKNSVDEPVRASPAVADNRLFIRGANHLYCIAKK
ncbi:MAG TPA: PQQ-binding-like beta-propeller repeat protein [Gemmataceae bacterium]|nr:PQQ-binding-like beta-propeller repeat protein [Gemmataceae bacterium]